MEKITIKTKGMHCVSCETVIKEALLSVSGVRDARADYTMEKATIEFDPDKTNLETIMKAVEDAGYEPEPVEEGEKKPGLVGKLFGRG